jgi:VCBS repeat-containing protein
VPASGVLANDADADGDPLATVLVSGPASGSLVFNTDGSFTYTPHADFNGTDSFTYLAQDGLFASAPATVTITVTPINDAPTGVADSYAVEPDSALSVTMPGVLTNDIDVDGDLLMAVLVSGTLQGQLTLHADGSFIYIPRAGYLGSDAFTYQVTDGTAAGNLVTVTIQVRVGGPTLPLPDDELSADGPTETGPTPPEPLPPLVVEVPTPRPQPPALPERDFRTHVDGVAGAAFVALERAEFFETVQPGGFDVIEEFEPLAMMAKALNETSARSIPGLAEAAVAFDVGLLWEDLADLKQQFNDTAALDFLVAGSAVGASGLLTVGYVLWTLRGGSLVIGLLAQMPAWRLVDPLVVLDYLEEEPRRKGRIEEDDSLESMLEHQRKEEVSGP